MIELAANPRQVRDIQNFQTEFRQVLKINRRWIVFVRRCLSAGLERKKP